MNTQDLAAQAAWEYERVCLDGKVHDHKKLVAIIQVACEKAWQAGNEHEKQIHLASERQLRAAQEEVRPGVTAQMQAITKAACEKAYAEGFVHGRSKRPYSDRATQGSEVEEQAWHDGTMSPEVRATIERAAQAPQWHTRVGETFPSALSIMGDDLCPRCGTRFGVDNYCENNHCRPRPK